MRDDIRKTKTSIFLTMVEEKLLLHGGVNGLVSDVNYQLRNHRCNFFGSSYLSNFNPGCDQCLILFSFCRADESPATKQ